MDKGRPMMDELAGPVCWRGTTPRGAGRPLSNQSPRKPSAKTRSQASVWGLGGPDGLASGGSAGAEGDPHTALTVWLDSREPVQEPDQCLCLAVVLALGTRGPVVLTAVVQQLTPSCSVAGADRLAGVGSTWCLVYNPLAHYGHRRAREQIVFILSTPPSSSRSVESPEPPGTPSHQTLVLDLLPVTPAPSCQNDPSTPRVLVSLGLTLLMWLNAHCSRPQAEGFSQGGLDDSRADLWASANTSLLQGFWCQPARQLSRDQLSALIRRMASQQVFLRAWQLSCLANLAARHGLQGDFSLHPADLLLFYNLTQVREANCRAFIRRAAQGHTELLANLPDQRAALGHAALACLGGHRPQLSASDLLLLGILVCDMDTSSIMALDPRVLQNLRRCARLTAAQQAALNTLLASGRTTLGPPGSWNLEGLQALGPLATYVSPGLWVQVQEAVGLGFFSSMVAACRAGQLSQRDARRFVTRFLEAEAKSVSSRPKRGTGRHCIHGDITAATLQDDLFLVRYDCSQLESCLGSHVLRANLDPLLQHPLPAECQRVVKAKLARIYPGGVPEEQLRRITSLVYLYSRAEISQWNITSRETVVALLASDVALENQTEAVLQKFLDHNGTVNSALLVAIGGSRLCWMSPPQIQAIRPSEFRLAGALDISSCPQSRKDVLYAKAREAFGSTRTTAAYYHLMRPYLGGAPVEELQHLAQENVSMDIDTFTNLNPRVLQSLSVGNVTTLLGQNVGDLQKARSHPTISSWLRSLNRSALSELGLDPDPVGPTGPAHPTTGSPNTTPWTPHLAPTSGQPGNDAPTSGSPPAHVGYVPLAVALPSSLLWLLYRGTCTMASKDGTALAPHAGKLGLVGRAGRLPHVPHPGGLQGWSPPTPSSQDLELD
ncbi:PREDICTED: mesothelin-like protein [Ceratotherium simum simum]|uniref:Mesothelin-like protein n=1 Tax=Ceratotherium simum simum TaxID=73337 RepID=A0ABM1DAS1_CERSS|nr:PREDICTED: mesothelin-like protein [Ceratotherium simum simum]